MLYSKATPKKMLPDLLKNNYLADPALSLVKSLDEIDEIWTRLKRAYGDANTMLSKKLSSVRNIGPLWKLRDSERLIEGLVNLTNAMTDLIKLSARHNVPGKLYNGEATDIIYGMMGEKGVTKWLGNIIDEGLEGEILWNRLITFLERESKLEQEKLLIKRRLDSTKPLPGDGNKSRSYWSSERQEETEEKRCTSCSGIGYLIGHGDGNECGDRNEANEAKKGVTFVMKVGMWK